MSLDHLPEEILIEILVKLPTRSLITGTSVCKAWRSLIRSPSFISAHLSNNENKALLRRCDTHDGREYYTVFPKRGGPFPAIKSWPKINCPFQHQDAYFRIEGYCDGLLCLSESVGPYPIIIWNPTIRNHLILHQPLIDRCKYHSIVLGFGVARNHYKVVRLLYRNYDSLPSPEAEIFTLGAGTTWRKLSAFDVEFRPWEYSSIFFKGFVHWLVYEHRSENRKCSWILTFHVGDEVFGKTMLPQELEGAAPNIFVMGESIAATNCIEERGNRRCDVWMMKDYGIKESWTKLYRIEIEGFRRVVGFWGNSEALLAIQGSDELVTYNAESGGIKHAQVSGFYGSFYLVDFKESLLLLGGYIGDSTEELCQEAVLY